MQVRFEEDLSAKSVSIAARSDASCFAESGRRDDTRRSAGLCAQSRSVAPATPAQAMPRQSWKPAVKRA
jgi:hypothetical protein